MAKNMHGLEIVVNADRADWGKRWGIVGKGDRRCWCYDCTMRRLTPAAGDVVPRPAALKSEGRERGTTRLNFTSGRQTMNLQCLDCGWTGCEPFDAGDACICGGVLTSVPADAMNESEEGEDQGARLNRTVGSPVRQVTYAIVRT